MSSSIKLKCWSCKTIDTSKFNNITSPDVDEELMPKWLVTLCRDCRLENDRYHADMLNIEKFIRGDRYVYPKGCAEVINKAAVTKVDIKNKSITITKLK